MVTFDDLTGRRFGRLVAVRRVPFKGTNRFKWECRCDCGSVVEVWPGDMKAGKQKSCGCLHREWVQKNLASHGLSRTREYRIRLSMIQRCTNPNQTGYASYGGRGITVCERWLESFENFLADMGEAPTSKHEIDRIDPNGNYEPSNCRWATRKTQQNNRQACRYYERSGERLTVQQWAEKLGIAVDALRGRLRLGWTFEDAISTPFDGALSHGLGASKDITGQRFGKLDVVQFSHTEVKRAYWLCRCECGTEKAISGKELRSGHTKSCGCFRGARGVLRPSYPKARKPVTIRTPRREG